MGGFAKHISVHSFPTLLSYGIYRLWAHRMACSAVVTIALIMFLAGCGQASGSRFEVMEEVAQENKRAHTMAVTHVDDMQELNQTIRMVEGSPASDRCLLKIADDFGASFFNPKRGSICVTCSLGIELFF